MEIELLSNHINYYRDELRYMEMFFQHTARMLCVMFLFLYTYVYILSPNVQVDKIWFYNNNNDMVVAINVVIGSHAPFFVRFATFCRYSSIFLCLPWCCFFFSVLVAYRKACFGRYIFVCYLYRADLAYDKVCMPLKWYGYGVSISLSSCWTKIL